MLNRHEFQQLAKKFRGGRISLSDFTDTLYPLAEQTTQEAPSDNESIHLRLPVRPENSHKGDFGRVLLVGGSEEMPGAIALSGMAALKTGAGLVVVITPNEAKQAVSSFSPCLMTTGIKTSKGLFSESAIELILDKSEWADVVAIGPGMGRSPGCQAIVRQLYFALEKPIVLDADAINNLVDSKIDWAAHTGERILTPHPGEFSRIADQSFEKRIEMEEYAIDFARRTGVNLLLKGPRTLVTNGERHYRNSSGNAGMATAGSGDVLTGVIASLIGQKMDAFDSAQIGAYVHGLAGDIYSELNHSASLIATDLIDYLPDALRRLEEFSSQT